MKKTISLLFALFVLTVPMFASNMPSVTIEGIVSQDFIKTIYLYKAVEGNMEEWGSAKVSNHRFAFALVNPEEGFYYIGDKRATKFLKYRFYVKDGERIFLDIKEDGYTIRGNSAENKLLNEWQQIFAAIYLPSYQFWSGKPVTYVTFFPKLKAFLPRAEAFRKNIQSDDKDFKTFFNFLFANDVESAALHFLETPRTVHPTREEYPDYYKNIVREHKYCGTKVLRLGDGLSRLRTYTTFIHMLNATKEHRDYLQLLVNSICNDTLKGYQLVHALGRYKSLDALQMAAAPYKHYLLTDSLRAKFDRSLAGVASLKKGEQGYNFNFPDTKGNLVSFTSLKGKIVLIDTWATWCGPCKQQIPYLKKLEEELEGKDIAIVSISVDEEKDHQKWLDMVAQENLGGIQLFAGGWNEFTDYYKIKGIPKFLIFDREGKIVTSDAPRPSDPVLKKLLLQLESAEF